jgi:ATPase subunit of ABC transporter with duplicated ATPase domains
MLRLLISHDRYFIERVGVNRVLVAEEGRLRAVESVDVYEVEVSAAYGGTSHMLERPRSSTGL